DGFVNVHSPTASFGFRSPDTAYLAVVEMGFAAVPRLLEYLGDKRLTRSRTDDFDAKPKRVGEIVLHFLSELAGKPLDEVAAKLWWAKAKAQSEETYLVTHALPKSGNHPNEVILRILCRRYPQHLPALYQEVLDKRPALRSEPLLEAIRLSSLPRRKQL